MKPPKVLANSVQLAMKVGMIDLPQRHKAHAQPTPLLGGVAMYVGFVVAVLVAAAVSPEIKLDTLTGDILIAKRSKSSS
jgi:UDP-GlcNAc:undecaprenyl-phosphate GlcNAc-1-phosphate transferase